MYVKKIRTTINDCKQAEFCSKRNASSCVWVLKKFVVLIRRKITKSCKFSRSKAVFNFYTDIYIKNIQ